MAPTEPETRRIVLLGKTGSGKSSLANTLFGEENLFKVNYSPNSGTKLCKSEIKNINGTNIQLIDTPGLFDTDPESSELSPEILRCITECAPGPHAFLLVMKMDKFTKQEQTVVELILTYFSEEALKYTTVVFTRGDDLPEEMKIEEWVNENEALRNLVQKCGGRCHVFDNKYWNNSQDQYRNNQYQVQELLKTIDKTVRENRGGYYTNEMLQKVGEEIEKKKIHIKETSPNISEESLLTKAKEFVYSKLKNNMGGAIVGVLLGAFLGAVLVAGIAHLAGAACLVTCVAGAGGAVGGAAVGALAGALVSEKDLVNKAVQQVKSFITTVTELFEKFKKNEKVLAVTDVVRKSKSD